MTGSFSAGGVAAMTDIRALREKVGTGFSQKAMRPQRLIEHWAIQSNRPMF
jgi:hypothetical protein